MAATYQGEEQHKAEGAKKGDKKITSKKDSASPDNSLDTSEQSPEELVEIMDQEFQEWKQKIENAKNVEELKDLLREAKESDRLSVPDDMMNDLEEAISEGGDLNTIKEKMKKILSNIKFQNRLQEEQAATNAEKKGSNNKTSSKGGTPSGGFFNFFKTNKKKKKEQDKLKAHVKHAEDSANIPAGNSVGALNGFQHENHSASGIDGASDLAKMTSEGNNELTGPSDKVVQIDNAVNRQDNIRNEPRVDYPDDGNQSRSAATVAENNYEPMFRDYCAQESIPLSEGVLNNINSLLNILSSQSEDVDPEMDNFFQSIKQGNANVMNNIILFSTFVNDFFNKEQNIDSANAMPYCMSFLSVDLVRKVIVSDDMVNTLDVVINDNNNTLSENIKTIAGEFKDFTQRNKNLKLSKSKTGALSKKTKEDDLEATMHPDGDPESTLTGQLSTEFHYIAKEERELSPEELTDLQNKVENIITDRGREDMANDKSDDNGESVSLPSGMPSELLKTNNIAEASIEGHATPSLGRE